MDFNKALDNIHEAARNNIIKSQLPRVRKQPELVIKYAPGDLVLRNPRRYTGTLTLRQHKLEPSNLGPYQVIEHHTNANELSNTVEVSEVNNSSKTHTFHASTLKIFPGTLKQAQELAKIDGQEFSINRVLTMHGNVHNKDTLEILVELEDNTHLSLTYAQAFKTEAFEEYCEKIVIGKVLSLTHEETAQFTKDHAPGPNQTVEEKIQELEENERIHVQDRRYITAHWWGTPAWSIYDERDTLPQQVRNREPLVEAIVKKFTKQRIDLEIPALAKSTGKLTKRYVISMSLPNLLLYSTKEDNIRELSVILTRDLMVQCKLAQRIHKATGF